MSFFEELKRRNVFRVAIAYVIVSWLVLQVIDVVFPMIGLAESTARVVLILLLVGLPIVLFLGWVYEFTPEGVKLESEVDRSQYDARGVGRKMDFFIIGVLQLGGQGFDQKIPRRDWYCGVWFICKQTQVSHGAPEVTMSRPAQGEPAHVANVVIQTEG